MTEKTTIKEIESRLTDDRADLASTLADLAGRIAPDYLSDQMSAMVHDYARPVAKKAEETVRSNPVAFAVAGAGLAWLLLSSRKDKPASDGVRAPLDALAADDLVTEDWLDEIDELRETASDRMHQLELDSRSTLDKTRDFATERAEMVSQFASDLRDTLNTGLHDLSEDARARVVRAREAAYSARLRVQSGVKSAGQSSSQMVKDHPVITAALGIAIGAAIVSVMPKPEFNRRSLGPRANRLIDEAQAAFAEEKRRARRLAGEVGDEMKRAAGSVADTARDEAYKTAQDISDQAISAGKDLSERLAQQLADEATRAIHDVGEHLRDGAKKATATSDKTH
ncbi:hypothetical protein FGG78_03255 [Thioclava sp. BHET1]|uniref:DUF3618 domain-containing protein n=1 Tax=Thioclava dalianensis TaxID=1185766 RepID=A0A074TNA5_9RHOB|nr:hypothetical protein [Thioclava dalianensis]KEP70473.1 hypothetical protein DL1_17485 [Thioclava dalianensis]TMV94070.1 hypothetical protein FGG78_03255 [Thioclava sp. BHET1]SFN32880.1 hypothetical protein SAMN05216224_104148 [Thioclava dalianensis]